ncbi:hypothetical protein [Deinococcus sp. Marseille-Q6407]|uniref:hypothetical protein n=1 Tax=Deinococcus sp. Marseille-Q6407 TaxID=2969223 RepID=UPI0021BFF51A|nr:hypothetical protein [Deinococcus sp. Marseille-Q6407]
MTSIVHLYMAGHTYAVEAAQAEARADRLARRYPGALVFVLTAEQAQELNACDPARRDAYLARQRVPSVSAPAPEPIWENQDMLQAVMG